MDKPRRVSFDKRQKQSHNTIQPPQSRDEFMPTIIERDSFDDNSFNHQQELPEKQNTRVYAEEANRIQLFIREHKFIIGVAIIIVLIVIFAVWFYYVRPKSRATTRPPNETNDPPAANTTEQYTDKGDGHSPNSQEKKVTYGENEYVNNARQSNQSDRSSHSNHSSQPKEVKQLSLNDLICSDDEDYNVPEVQPKSRQSTPTKKQKTKKSNTPSNVDPKARNPFDQPDVQLNNISREDKRRLYEEKIGKKRQAGQTVSQANQSNQTQQSNQSSQSPQSSQSNQRQHDQPQPSQQNHSLHIDLPIPQPTNTITPNRPLFSLGDNSDTENNNNNNTSRQTSGSLRDKLKKMREVSTKAADPAYAAIADNESDGFYQDV
jgi:hypothetical protein